MMSVGGLPCSVVPAAVVSTCATPSPFDLMFSMSPAWWCVPLVGLPCSADVGLKCPPALLPSGALQSPFSWTWKPNSALGFRPCTVPVMCTPSDEVLNATDPVTVLPWVGAICAAPSAAGSAGVAFPAGAAAVASRSLGAPAGCSFEQAASNTVAAIARPRIVAFMSVAPRSKEAGESSIVGTQAESHTLRDNDDAPADTGLRGHCRHDGFVRVGPAAL